MWLKPPFTWEVQFLEGVFILISTIHELTSDTLSSVVRSSTSVDTPSTGKEHNCIRAKMVDEGEESFSSKTQLRPGVRGRGKVGAEAGMGWRGYRVFARTLGSIPSEQTKELVRTKRERK